MKNMFKQVTLAITVLIAGCNSIVTETPKTAWKFCVTGDSRGSDQGINSAVLKRLVTEIKQEQPEYVLFVGDLVNGYTNAKNLKKQLTYWRDTFMAPLIDADIAVYPCRGNHDAASLVVWNQVFSDKFQLPQNGPDEEKNITYKIAKHNAVVLCLDSYMPKKRHRINQEWFNDEVKQVTASKTPLHLFAFSHEPAYAVKHQDCLDDFPERRDELVETFLSAGGRALFFGHDHRYHHAVIPFRDKKLHQFIVGTAGAPWRIWNGKYNDTKVEKIIDASVFGYMLVEINGNQVTMTMKGWTLPGKNGKPAELKVIDILKYQINQ